MRVHWSSTIVVGAFVAMGGAAAGQTGQASARSAAGYVVDLSGEWVAAGRHRPLVLGDSVLSGETIRGGAHAVGAQRISVVVRGIDALRSVCDFPASQGAAPRCPPVVIPSSSRTAGETFSQVMTNAMALFRSHDERRYASLVSRGAGAALSDAVVPLRGDVGDLAAAFAGLDSGRYAICLRAASVDDGSDNGAVECAVRAERQWPATAGATLPVDGLRAGLYEMRVSDGRRAWVLVSDERTFAPREAELARMKTTVQGWGDRVPDAAKRRMLRVYLAALAADDTHE